MANPPLTDPNIAAAIAAVAEPPGTFGGADPADLQDAIVLRGYLRDSGLIQINAAAAPNFVVWRLYLSARMDSYVDFKKDDVVRIVPYAPQTPDSIPGAVTVWLTIIPVPRRYFVSKVLQGATGFVSGEMLEDAMGQQDARAEAWPEQQYGSTGWARTGAICPRP